MARILPRDRVIHERNIVQGGIVMIRVGIIGASGMAGSAIYKLRSTKKDLNVTGIVRNESKARKILGDDANLISEIGRAHV